MENLVAIIRRDMKITQRPMRVLVSACVSMCVSVYQLHHTHTRKRQSMTTHHYQPNATQQSKWCICRVPWKFSFAPPNDTHTRTQCQKIGFRAKNRMEKITLETNAIVMFRMGKSRRIYVWHAYARREIADTPQ